uniref:Chromodomain helicase DNA binding protein 6 n=1 Tax=Gadus morhua TaxID=8049 RepID=A0A8C5BC03_GADMO
TSYLISNLSYMHCKWATLDELEKDPRIHQKIKRFRTKHAQMKHLFIEPDEDLFNPDYIEVDRILEVAVTTDTETGEEVTHYLVKWCSLSYEEATWELQEDLDASKIKDTHTHTHERPLPDKWQKLEHSKDYRGANQLREYQLEGMNWLLFNWYHRKNCILADEMGLGKTIQSITFLYEMFSLGIRGPFLVIAPLSTITNWEREFRTWTPLNAIVYHGSQISRQMILQYEMFYRDPQGNSIPGVLKFHGVITTFEMIMADCPELKKLHWRCVVIDEAHRLKNRNCKLLEGLKMMNLEHKVLLTGTPLQNSVEELFSLLNFLEPLQFPSESTFLEEFGDLKTEEQVKKLQAILKPMMLRRLKDDVEKNLAPKEETIIEVELTNMQKKYYRAILEKNFSFLSKGANQHNMPNLINTMMELRKCCNHPYLITGAEEKILDSFRKSHSPDAWDFQLQAMIQGAGKLVLIDKLLPKLLAGGHKVLVFSQMVRCLDILEDYLIQRRYTYERIDGRVRGNLRQAAIDRFSRPDSDRFVFLLCTRAGGLGINLTAADTCIIFDSDWNPQNDLQAQARCHRIGQSKAVKVYRLITRNSYEREMFDKASLKLGLDKAVLQDINRKGSVNGTQQLSKLEVEDLLRKGAYGALMDDEDEGSKFCEEDIDQILQRRTQTITIESEGKGSTFAKASFVSSGNRTDISLDDPNFWAKWAKIAELEIDSKSEKESLVIDTPRVRKQTRHYNSFEDDELMEFSELDSDSEERPSRSRRLGERARRYLRAECFRVEKNLLIFGWGRWKDILNHGRFKWHLTENDMEAVCRALLVYCLRHYKGDDKIKSFIWDLITPSKEGQDQALMNHSGLSVPVPRGRKGKKLKNQLNAPEVKSADWLVHCNPEVVLQDDSYKKHLKQHCNKVLLRVRMLYYLKVEVLGEAANQALEGIPASKLEVALPDIDYIEIPAGWWDREADKSLLIGVHKHGYERYMAMRADPELCFLERVGMPDAMACVCADVLSPWLPADSESAGEPGVLDEAPAVTMTTAAPLPPPLITDTMATALVMATPGTGSGTGSGVAELQLVQAGPRPPTWPAGPALTARLRRLVAAYQRFTMRREPLPLRPDYLMHDEMLKNVGFFCRWTRREQADFYRTVSSFGVVYDPERKAFDWSTFRALARLERKTDQSLERYFSSFVNMCRTACRLPPRKDEGESLMDAAVFVEPLTEERAARTLYRIELLRKIREQVLRHPLLSARLQLCRPSLYLPVWWEGGKHDRDLLIGAARHGLSRTDYFILNDPQLTFLDAHRNYVQKESQAAVLAGYGPHHHLHSNLQASKGKTHPLDEQRLIVSGPRLNNKPKSTFYRLCSPGPVPVVESYPPSPRFASSLAMCELPDGLHDAREPTIAQLLQEKALYSFSEWPKDRVIINRLDSICHAVLKGKWPSSSQQYDSPSSLAANPCLWRLTSLPLLQERLVAPPYLPELKRAGGRRPYDYEAAILASASKTSASSSSSLSGAVGCDKPPLVAPPSHRVGGSMLLNGWQEVAIDLTKPSMGGGEGAMTTMTTTTMAGSGNKLPPPITAPLGGLDMAGILQAGLIHPVTGQIVNGNTRGDDSLRRRRGRRRNMEALYSEFAKSRGLQLQEAMVRGEAAQWNLSAIGSFQSRCLVELRRYPLPPPPPQSGLHGLVERPKQRRHRCKDPTKLDVSSLTGEERVPVVHRGTGRRLGGAMAPAIKELSQWLDANSEYYVAPDWADVIKTSGFLPEVKFGRILTEPIHRDPGSRRRGRRPRSEMPKPLLSVSEASGLAPPLFLNGGMMGSMDSMVAMQNLRAGLPGIPISGIMAAGFPHGFAAAVSAAGAGGSSSEDGKNGLSMLPMMLHHSMSHPQHAMFSVGALMSPHPSSSSAGTAMVTTTTTVQSAPGDLSPSPSQRSMTPAERDGSSPSSRSGGGGGEGKDRRREEKGGGGGGGAGGDGGQRLSGADAVAIITSSSGGHLTSSHLSSGHLTSQGGHLSLQGGHLTSGHMTSQGGHLGFNPFLIPSMSHGLLYPHMFLPHGGVMTLPAMPPTPPNGPPAGSPKRRRKRVREEERFREEESEARGAEERDAAAQAEAEALLHPSSSSSSSLVLPSSSSSSLSDPPAANQNPITREPQPPNPPPTGGCSGEQREEEVERGVEMRRGEELEGGEEVAGAVVTREEEEKEVCEPDRRMEGEEG